MSESESAPAGQSPGGRNIGGDIFGGLTAGIVALPLALGFGATSGIENGAAAGLYGAIAVGLLAAIFGGTPSQISGPTGPITVVVAGVAATLTDNPAAIFGVVALAGLFQVVLGLLRLGGYIHYVPYPVVSGFMTGIGAIIICLQIPILLGSAPVKSPFEAILGVPEFVGALDPLPLVVGLGTIAVVYATPRLTASTGPEAAVGQLLRRMGAVGASLAVLIRAAPGTLVALVLGTAVCTLTGLEVTRISAIPQGLPVPRLPTFDMSALNVIIPGALAVAILGSVDSLLTSLVADRITKTQHDSNRELVGQGLGNMAAGMIGGLAGAGATMRTVVNVQSGGRNRLSGVIHSLLLLGVLIGLAPLAQQIPTAVLAGILVTVGIGILDYRGLKDIARVPRGDAAVMLLVLVLTVVVDLMWAVAAGVVLAALMFVKTLGDRHPAPAASPEEAPELATNGGAAAPIEVRVAQTALFFGNASALRRALEEVQAGTLVLCLSDVKYVDQSAAYVLADVIQELRARGVRVAIAGVQAGPREVLERIGVVPGLVPPEDVFASRDKALAVVGPSKEQEATA